MQLVIALLAATALAACTGGAKVQDVPPAAVTDTTGGLEGQIVDEEQVPVAGASIGVRQVGGPSQNQTTSSPSGAFSFSSLAPGDYDLLVQAAFFEPARQKVAIAAGEVTRATVLLKRIPLPAELLVETFPKRGFITCSVGWTITTGTYYSNPCQDVLGNDANFPVPLNPELAFREVVLELVWQPGSPSSGTSLRMNLCSQKDDTTNYYGPCVAAVGQNPYYRGIAGGPPLVMRQSDLPLATVKQYEVAVGDGGPTTANPRVPFTFQQSFDLYMSLCYNQNCTADFTALPPG